MQESEFEKTIDEIADSFAARLERGERPSIEEYKTRYPKLADRIDAVLPALVMLENVDSDPLERKLAVDDSIPQILGEYEIIQEVGRGGMGIVFEAQHLTMRRRVALKVLPKSFAERPNYLSRFLTEARSAGQLHHTNIVPVFEVGEADGLHFYAMQFIHGDNLDRVIEDIQRLRRENQKANPRNGSRKPPTDPIFRTQRIRNELSESVAASMLNGHSLSDQRFDGQAHFTGQLSGATPPDSSLEATNSLPGRPVHSGHAERPDRSETTSLSDNVFGSKDSTTVNRSPNSAYHQRVAAVGIQVAEALEHAHSHGVLHRDVKPANLILDTDGNVWVTDFGLAKLANDDLTHTGDIIGTLRYMAPERFAGSADGRSDIFSLGLTLYELATLKSAFDADRASLVKDAGTRSTIAPRKIDETIPADLETIILKSIESQPERRYQTANELAEDLRLFLADRPIKARRSSLIEKGWRICRRNPVASTMAACIVALLVFVALTSLQFALYKAEQTRAEISTRKEIEANLYLAKLDQAKMRRFSRRIGQRFETLSAVRDATNLLPLLDFSAGEIEAAKIELRSEAIAAMSLTDLRTEWELGIQQEWGGVSQFSFDENFARLAQVNQEGDIRVFDTEAQEVLVEIPNPYPGLSAWVLRMSPDGEKLGIKYHEPGAPRRDYIGVVWDLKHPEKPVLELKGLAEFTWSDDNRYLAMGRLRRMEIYETSSWNLVKEVVPNFASESSVDFAEFSANGSELVVASRSNSVVELWNVMDWPEHLRTFEVEENVFRLDWDSDRKVLAIGGSRGGLYFWNGDYDSEPNHLALHQNSIIKIAIHPTRLMVATSAWDQTSRLTDLLSRKEVLKVEKTVLGDDGFSQDGRLAFFDKERIGIWEVARPLLEMYKATGLGWDSQFHPEYQDVVVRTVGSSVEFWNTKSHQLLHVIDDLHVRDMAFINKGKTLITSGDGGLNRFPFRIEPTAEGGFEIKVGEPRALFSRKTGRFEVLKDELSLVISIGSRPHHLDVNTGEVFRKFGRHSGLTVSRVTADEKYVLTGTWHGEGVRVWDMDTGELVNTVLEDGRSLVPTANPGQANQFIVGNGGLRRFEINGSEILANDDLTHPLYDNPRGATFSKDGRSLLLKDSSFDVFVAAPETGKPIAKVSSAESSRIVSLSFSPDANKVAFACHDNLQVLDLYKIREELRKFGLDW